MKRIKIFIASSKELEQERDKFASMINQLNRIWKKRDIELELIMWEYLDSSMGKEHKQEEYNKELKNCEICVALFCESFGDYTKEELEVAYKQLIKGYNPQKLYFKQFLPNGNSMRNNI